MVANHPYAPVGQFGNKFRKAREAKNLSYDDVSNVTKIGARMLQAIEEEHFDLLPGGVFNKGFIRAYAKHLGLNDEDAVSDYLACLRQAQVDAAEQANDRNDVREPAHAVASAKSGATKSPQPYAKPTIKKQAEVEVADELPDLQLPRAEHVRPPRREHLVRESSFPWTPILALVLIVVIAAFFFIRHAHKTKSLARATQPLSTMNTLAASPSATPATSTSGNAQSQTKTPSSTSSPTSVHTSSDVPVIKDVAIKKDATATASKQPEQTATPAANTKPFPKMTLVIRAAETSWISVTADGQLVSEEMLIAPANVTIHAREVTVKVGNAAGLSFVWNNQDYPAQGAEAEVKTLVFDAAGMRLTTPQPIQPN
jgi:cytoskeletal protein RodZ